VFLKHEPNPVIFFQQDWFGRNFAALLLNTEIIHFLQAYGMLQRELTFPQSGSGGGNRREE
jgi:hypothetical protein